VKDLIIIGAGPGGFDAALYAAKNNLETVLIEAHKVGGTCLNWGCVPTKALYQNAKAIHQATHVSTFGVIQDAFHLDFDLIKTRKEAIVEAQIKGIHQSIKAQKVTFIEGKGQIINPNEVRVNDEIIKAKHIIIATGSSSKKLAFPGDDLPIIKTSKSILDLDVFPKKLLVVGAGVIGTEMAQIFKAFGAEVTLIDFAEEILMTEDVDIRKRARNLFKRAGLEIHTNASLKEVVKAANTYLARFETKKGLVELEVDMVLLAVGRTPNFGDLNLEGIKHTSQGIKVNENKQTSIPNIYAIGDVNAELMLAHKATYDGYRAVNHILNKADAINFDLVPSVIFTHPLIASVGIREDDLNKEDIHSVKALYKGNAKAVSMDETDGFVKLITDKNHVLIGAHIIGAGADYMIHELTTLINLKKTVSEAHDIIHAHPTVSEIIHDALRQLH
jgi:dihydrolipoamide dehydrogenase